MARMHQNDSAGAVRCDDCTTKVLSVGGRCDAEPRNCAAQPRRDERWRDSRQSRAEVARKLLYRIRSNRGALRQSKTPVSSINEAVPSPPELFNQEKRL